MEKSTFKAHIDFRGSVPLILTVYMQKYPTQTSEAPLNNTFMKSVKMNGNVNIMINFLPSNLQLDLGRMPINYMS